MLDKLKRMAKKSKKGMSLIIVLVSISMLVVMGTLFTTIALRSYNYSYAKMCQQQAYYTAQSAVDELYSLVRTDGEALAMITEVLENKYENIMNADPNADITQVYCTVGKYGGTGAVEGEAGSIVADYGLFSQLMGECTIRARFTNKACTQLAIEALATYKGYSKTVGMNIARTNEAALELAKVFEKTFAWTNPITTIITAETIGDVYIGSPGTYQRNAQGQIIDNDYNRNLRDNVYGKVQANTSNATSTGHTKPLDIYNYELRSVNGELYYNDWVELYMFSQYQNDLFTVEDYLNGNIAYPRNKTAINGNLYVQSQALIGLWDKSDEDKVNMIRWDNGVDNKEKTYDVTYNLNDTGNSKFDSSKRKTYFSVDNNYEHGFNGDVFFDHAENQIPVENTKFRVNGDMWFWEDVRIENFDSVYTYNAYKGIKNNIYALKDLVIDGYCYTTTNNDGTRNNKNEVSIFGDVMVQGNAQISDCVIYGDVYCNGDVLTMYDCTVYGNVYFKGTNFTMDYCSVISGWAFEGTSYAQYMPGGNIVIEGLNPDGTRNITKSSFTNNGYSNDNNGFATNEKEADALAWGAYFTNCSVTGTILSYVNTKINVAKWNKAKEQGYIDMYKNIICDGYLLFNLRDAYDKGWNSDGAEEGSRTGLENNQLNKSDNRLSVVAEKLTILQTQVGDRYAHLYFDDVFVGSGGAYIEGRQYTSGVWPWQSDHYTVEIDNAYIMGSNLNRSYIKGVYHNGFKYAQLYSNVPIMDSMSSVATPIDLTQIASKLKVYMDSVVTDNTFNGSTIDAAADATYNFLAGKFATFDGNDFHLGNVGEFRPLNEWDKYGFPENDEWTDKKIDMQDWTAPEDSNDPDLISLDKIYYVKASSLADLQAQGVTSSGYNKYIDIDYANKVIEIKTSVHFTEKIEFDNANKDGGYTIKFNSVNGNLHIKFDKGVVFGNNSKVVLKGGNMTFLYLYSINNNIYQLSNPEMKIGAYSRIGIVEHMEEAERQADSIYVVSNDDIVINIGLDVAIDGYFYAPDGHVDMAGVSEEFPNSVLNGCMAVGGYIMDVSGSSNHNTVINKYYRCVFNHVEAPLITDTMFGYGDGSYGDIIWEYLGYY